MWLWAKRFYVVIWGGCACVRNVLFYTKVPSSPRGGNGRQSLPRKALIFTEVKFRFL